MEDREVINDAESCAEAQVVSIDATFNHLSDKQLVLTVISTMCKAGYGLSTNTSRLQAIKEWRRFLDDFENIINRIEREIP